MKKRILFNSVQTLGFLISFALTNPIMAQDEIDALLESPATRTTPTPTNSVSQSSSKTNSNVPAIPKLGDYVELDETIRNEMYGSIDFPNAELKDIIKSIAKLSGKNFILDRKIENRKITIVSPNPVTKQEAYNAFLSALYMNDLTIVSMGKFLKVIEVKSAVQSNIRVFSGDNIPASEEVVTVLYKLKYLNVEEIQRYLNDLIARNGRVGFYPNTNTLVMTDTGLNLRRIVNILKSIDIAGTEDQLENIPIRYASAKTIASLIDEILSAQTGNRRPTGGAARGQAQKTRGGGIITKIVPDERTNSLVVLANGAGLTELKNLVSKLDTPDAAGGGNIHIYYCKNAVAEELATTISNLISGAASKGPTSGNNRATPNIPNSPATNTLVQGSGGGGDVRFEGNIKITSDKATNALVVVASGSDFAALKTILAKLDIPRRQVYVEATIMEVSAIDSREVGLGVNYAQNGIAQAGGFIPSNLKGAETLTSMISTPAGIQGLVGSFSAGKKVEVTVGTQKINISSVTGLIKAIQDSAQGNILHQPQILTSDNQEALIEVKNRLAVQTGTTLVGTSATPQAVFGKEDVTISLKITPQIGKDNDLIRLKVEQQIDDFEASTTQTGQFNVNNRKANTMVVVRNGDTIVVGGLQKDTMSDTSSRFPILGDIPIIGWLFKGKKSETRRSNLVLFLTPYIINEYSDLIKITERKLEEREKRGRVLFDPKDRMAPEVGRLKEITRENLKKSRPKGWAFGAGSDDESPVPPQDQTRDSPSIPGESQQNSLPANTPNGASAFIQPEVKKVNSSLLGSGSVLSDENKSWENGEFRADTQYVNPDMNMDSQKTNSNGAPK